VSVSISQLGDALNRYCGLRSKDQRTMFQGCSAAATSVSITACFRSPSNRTVPAHCAWDTVEWLCSSTLDFVAPDIWPPNSLHLSPVDYAIWSVMQQCVYQTGVHNINELRQRHMTMRCTLEQCAVNVAINQWQCRMSACVDAEGWHFEHHIGLWMYYENFMSVF